MLHWTLFTVRAPRPLIPAPVAGPTKCQTWGPWPQHQPTLDMRHCRICCETFSLERDLRVQYICPSEKESLEFFLNRAELSLNSVNSGNPKITEPWIGLNLKILSLHVSCWCCGSILVSLTRPGRVAGSSSFTVMTNIFVTEFSETFRKNSVMQETYCFFFHWLLQQ